MIQRIVKKYFPVLDKIKTIFNAIDTIVTDQNNNIYVKFKKDLILETDGNFITYTKNGVCIQKSKLTFINPKLNTNTSYTRIGDENLVHECKKQAGIEYETALREQTKFMEEHNSILDYIKKQKDK